MTERAVSVTVNYVLTLTITTLLLSGLVVSAGGLIESQSEEAIHSELDVLGQQLAADIESADRLATIAEGTEAQVEIETRLPGRVGGTGYTIDVNDMEKRIELQTTDPDVSVTVQFTATTPISTESTIRGGDVLIHWSESGGELVIESA